MMKRKRNIKVVVESNNFKCFRNFMHLFSLPANEVACAIRELTVVNGSRLNFRLRCTACLLGDFHVQSFVDAALKLVYLSQSCSSNGDIGLSQVPCLSLRYDIVVTIWCNLRLDQSERSSNFRRVNYSLVV
jgi:hypothetical protein